MGDDRRRQFGLYLAGLRRRTGKSQRQLAALLCVLSGTQSITRNEISRWERGGRIPDTWLPFLAAAPGPPPPSPNCCRPGIPWSRYRRVQGAVSARTR